MEAVCLKEILANHHVTQKEEVISFVPVKLILTGDIVRWWKNMPSIENAVLGWMDATLPMLQLTSQPTVT